jgi:ADP-ribose pyrophosphatase
VTPEEVARRELCEEIGGVAADLHYVGQFHTSNGVSNQVAYVYLATGIELGESQPESTGMMEIRLVPAAEALRMVRESQIACADPAGLPYPWGNER